MVVIQILCCKMFRMVHLDNILNNHFYNNNHHQIQYQLKYHKHNHNYFNKIFNTISLNYFLNNNFIKIVAIIIYFNKKEIVIFMNKDITNMDNKKFVKNQW